MTLRRLADALRSANEHEQAIVACCAGAAALALLAYASNASHGLVKFNDFYREVAPAYGALAHGHLLDFFRRMPAYGGSVVLRTPFAMVPELWGGSPRAIYFASAVPCLLADVGFCLWLAAQPRRGGSSPASRLLPIGCCIVSPIVLIAMFGGHPEEILGAVLCVAAVVLAANGRAGWAGVVVGLAVANKPWALVAVPVVIAVLPAERWRALLISAATAAIVLIPIFATRDHGVSGAANGSNIGAIFNPTQFLWWFGHRAWIAQEARPGIVVVSAMLAVLWFARRNSRVAQRSREGEALLLLALVLVLRAAFDPWSNVYYHLPFLFALIAYEVRSGRTPFVMTGYTFVLLLVVPIAGPIPMSEDLRAVVYAAVVLPAIIWLALTLYAPSRPTLQPLVARLRGQRVTASALPAAPLVD